MAIKLAVKKHIFVTAGIALVILASPFIWYWYQAEQFVSGLCENTPVFSKHSKDRLFTFEIVEQDCGAASRFISIAQIKKNTWPLKTKIIFTQGDYKNRGRLSGVWDSERVLTIRINSSKKDGKHLLNWEGVQINILKLSDISSK